MIGKISETRFRIFLALAVSFLICFSIVLFVELDSPQEDQGSVSELLGISTNSPQVEKQKTSLSQTQIAPVDSLVAGLKQRLEQNPDDMQGWLLLAKSYLFMRQNENAQQAFLKAQALGYTGKLELLAAKKNRQSRPADVLRAPLPQNSFITAYLRNQNTESQFSGHPTTKKHSSQSAAKLLVSVKLDDSLIDKINGDQVVFIFVRPFGDSKIDTNGPPIVALRKTVRDLPLYVAIDDDMALLQNRKISQQQQVVIGARLSLSGEPLKQAGDIEQVSQPISPNNAAPISLVLASHHDVTDAG